MELEFKGVFLAAIRIIIRYFTTAIYFVWEEGRKDWSLALRCVHALRYTPAN